MVVQSGRYGGTYARSDIAFKFAAWLSVEFELYLVKEFQRLKAKEQELIGWSAKRELAKINYRIHTDAIKENLIPPQVSRAQMNVIYASEADVLNVAIFGQTHQQWQAEHPDLKGNQCENAARSRIAVGPFLKRHANTSPCDGASLASPAAASSSASHFWVMA